MRRYPVEGQAKQPLPNAFRTERRDRLPARRAVDRSATAKPVHADDGGRRRRLLDGDDDVSHQHVERGRLSHRSREPLAYRPRKVTEVELPRDDARQLRQAAPEAVAGSPLVTFDQPMAL